MLTVIFCFINFQNIQVGMSKDKLCRVETCFDEGIGMMPDENRSVISCVIFRNEVLYEVEFNEDKQISRILTFDNKAITSKGLGIGSRFSEIKEKEEKFELDISPFYCRMVVTDSCVYYFPPSPTQNWEKAKEILDNDRVIYLSFYSIP